MQRRSRRVVLLLLLLLLLGAGAAWKAGIFGGGTAAKEDREASKPAQPEGTAAPAPPPERPEETPSLAPTLTVEIADGVVMEFVLAPAGSFRMGSEAGDADEKPVVDVTLAAFYVGRHEVTQAQWAALMPDNPSAHKDPRNPVESVTWDECVAFLATARAPEGWRFALPSEAQWEYACRAGTTTAYHFGDDPAALSAHGWHKGNADGRPHAVGTGRPNAWGLYDVHGNVWEWCADGWHDSHRGAPGDGSVRAGGRGRVLRGGSWVHPPEEARAASRPWCPPTARNSYRGFGAVLVSAP